LRARDNWRGALAALLAAVGLLVAAPSALARPQHHERGRHLNGIIFVHGFEGSGAQFESQQLRLTSNGYPARYINVFEYDSSQFAGGLKSGGIPPQQEAPLFAELDQLIAHVKAVTHRRKVDLLAHSLGTRLMQDYLNSSKQRARNVAHYVNIDGFPENSLPGGVRTLALWGTKGPISAPGRSIRGAKNVTLRDCSHVQAATSPVSFAQFYKFFTGKRPRTVRIVPQKGRIKLSGRAVNFPENSGLAGATVQMWAINQTTGRRTRSAPVASFSVGSTGNWGPVTVRAGRRYEFALVRPGEPVHHFYFERFVRSDHLIRLLESDTLRLAGGVPDPRSTAMVILRYKEIWGDQGSQSDVLTVNGLSVCNPTTCPLSKEVNALFVADFNHNGQSNPTQTWPTYQALGFFVSSVDVFVPAHSPPTGEVTIGITSRGKGPRRTMSIPNFAATTDVVSVQLNDYDRVAHARRCARGRSHAHAARCR
jgi:pimeloyl-ACP methyl ester carboxylesterase